jgi:hypothetical protein
MPLSFDGAGIITGLQAGGLPDNSITSTELANDAVTTAKIADDAVTVGKTSFTGDLEFNSGYGSAATAYGVRAWVNFNGTGTVAIRNDGNVSSITDNGNGDYTVNFSSSMPDANYCVTVASRRSDVGSPGDVNVSADIQSGSGITPLTTGSVRVCTGDCNNVAPTDSDTVCVAVFR